MADLEAPGNKIWQNYFDYWNVWRPAEIEGRKKLEKQDGGYAHQHILNEIHNLYLTKNKDYGSSTKDTYKKYGMVSYLVRLEDKLNRARTLVQNKNQEVKDEKLEDTLLDLANYAILAVMELREQNNG